MSGKLPSNEVGSNGWSLEVRMEFVNGSRFRASKNLTCDVVEDEERESVTLVFSKTDNASRAFLSVGRVG